MFNTSYFKYLIKSKIVLILLILVWTILSSLFLRNSLTNYFLLFFLEVLLAYVLPCLLFSFIHEKRAVDTYFSINISRKSLLTTSLIFGVMLMSSSYIIGSLLTSILNSFKAVSFPELLLNWLLFIFVISAIFIFNTFIYFECNNHSDGIIMMIAYTILPLAIMIVVNLFINNFIYGGNIEISKYFAYLSIIYDGGLIFSKSLSFEAVENLYIAYIVLTLVVIFITYFLYKRFNLRKVERAGSPSSNFLSYPFIIYSYVFICIFGIGCLSSLYISILEFFKDTAILYLLTFILFVIAHFIYRRKFYISIKMPVFFVAAVVVSLLLCELTIYTKGFGLPYLYESPDKNITYNLEYDTYDLDLYNDNIYQEYINEIQKIDAKLDKKVNCIKINIEIKASSKPILQSTLDIINKYREKAIDNYYSGNIDANGYMYVVKDKNKKDNYLDINIINSYDCFDVMSFNDLIDISKDDNTHIDITIYNMESEKYYRIKNGEIIISYDAVEKE